MDITYFNKFYNSLDGVYSIMDIEFPIKILTPANLLNNEKYEDKYDPVFLDSTYNKDIYHKEGIFKHSNGFFIHLVRNTDNNEFKIRIVYKPKQYEEIKIFINNLKKIK